MTIEKLLEILENFHAPSAEIFFMGSELDEHISIDGFNVSADNSGSITKVVLR